MASKRSKKSAQVLIAASIVTSVKEQGTLTSSKVKEGILVLEALYYTNATCSEGI
jgi:hypothetical protein